MVFLLSIGSIFKSGPERIRQPFPRGKGLHLKRLFAAETPPGLEVGISLRALTLLPDEKELNSQLPVVVLLLRGPIFCLEFKTRQGTKKENMQSYIEQVLDYALDLKNFHLLSQNRIIVPILIHPWISKNSSVFQASVYDDSIYNPLLTGPAGLQQLIADVLAHAGATAPDPSLGADWIISPYSPTPTIIEAAKRLYENHSVEDITRHEADKVSTDRTIAYILDVIKTSQEKGEKSICFVTGVPGAGKTLVGLDVAVKQSYQNGEKLSEDEGAFIFRATGR